MPRSSRPGPPVHRRRSLVGARRRRPRPAAPLQRPFTATRLSARRRRPSPVPGRHGRRRSLARSGLLMAMAERPVTRPAVATALPRSAQSGAQMRL